jgi:hypothetical protein
MTDRPSPSTVTDEELVASIMAAIEAAPPVGGLSLTYGQVEHGVRTALAARSTVTDEEYWQLKCLSIDAVAAPSAATDEGLVERVARRVYANVHHLMHVTGIEAQQAYEQAATSMLEASGHTALLRENKVLREALLTAQLLTVAHRKRVEDKLDAILQGLGKPGENG